MSHRSTTTFTYNPHATFKTWHDQEANHQFPKGRKILFISLLKIIKKKPVVANSSGQLEILLLAVQFTFDILISTLSLQIISYLHTQHIICNQKKNIPKSKSLTQLKINNMVASGFNSSLLVLFVSCYQAVVVKKAPGSVRKVKRTFLNHA